MSSHQIAAYADEDQPGQHRIDLRQDWGDEDPLMVILIGPNAELWRDKFAKFMDASVAEFDCNGTGKK